MCNLPSRNARAFRSWFHLGYEVLDSGLSTGGLWLVGNSTGSPDAMKRASGHQLHLEKLKSKTGTWSSWVDDSVRNSEFAQTHPLSQWCHPTISSSVTRFFSCPQSFCLGYFAALRVPSRLWIDSSSATKYFWWIYSNLYTKRQKSFLAPEESVFSDVK